MSPHNKLFDLPTQRSKIIIQEILDDYKIQDYDISVTPGSQKGDNYMSDIFRIKIRSKAKDLDLIMKIVLPGLQMKNLIDINVFFKREIFVYDQLFPVLNLLQDEYGLKDEDRFKHAALYKGCVEESNELLVMEDLTVTGFKMHDRHKAFDFEHASLCIKTLARTHACTIALKDKKPDFYKAVQERCAIITEYGEIFKSLIENSKTVILNTCKGELYCDKMVQFYANAFDELNILIDSKTAAPYNVICHGDSWCNNFLFKYEGDRVVDMRMVDWQAIRDASPVTDISFMLLLSSDKELRAKHYYELLDIYYKTLSLNLTKMDVDINKYYPEHIYREHVKKFMKYGFILAALGIQVVLGDKGDAVDLSGLIGNETKLVTSDRAINRLKDIIVDCIEYGIL